MWFPSIRTLVSRSRRHASARPRRQAVRPTLELLEDRCVPANFIVTSTADSGAGSLRAAIAQVNADKTDSPLNPDRINFQIPGSGIQTIQPLSPLPHISRPVVIDGYTQPGAQQNTLATGDNANLLIGLQGNLLLPGSNGLVITGSSTIRGLFIGGFTGFGGLIGSGIFVQGKDNRVQGNFLYPNQDGVRIVNGFNNLVGTDESDPQIIDVEGDGFSDAGERNVIVANSADGVEISGGSGNYISGNFIGADPSGHDGPAFPNGGAGVRITQGGKNNVIGGDAVRSNLIAFNHKGGVVVEGEFSAGNAIQVNSIYGNQPLDIDLGNDGVTLNTPGGPHTGPNNLQSFPVITAAQPGATTLVQGSLASSANATFTIDFYASTLPSPDSFQDVPYGGGQRWLGSVVVNTNLLGFAGFAQTLSAATSANEWIAATATDSKGNTSEFSIAHQLPIAVLNTTSWIPIGPAPSSRAGAGRIDVAAPDPTNSNVMYVGANNGGIWKTTNWLDPFPIWTPLTDLPQVSSLAIHEHDLVVIGRGTILAAASGPGGGILRSDDAGQTWVFLANPVFDHAEFGALVVDPNVANAQTLYVAVSSGAVNLNGSNEGLYKSVDGGQTWFNPVSENPFHTFSGYVSDLLEIQENGQTVLYAADSGRAGNGNPFLPQGGIYRSDDGGTNWLQTALPLDTFFPSGTIRLAGGTAPNERIYASILDKPDTDPPGVVHRFASSGFSQFQIPQVAWTALPDLPIQTTWDRFRHIVLAVDPTDSNTVYVNLDLTQNPNPSEKMMQSKDGGMHFSFYPDPTTPNSPDDPVAGTFDLTGAFVLVGDNGIERFDPATSNLEFRRGDLNTHQFYTVTLDPKHPQTAYGAAQDYPVLLSSTGSQVWGYSQPFDQQTGEAGKVRVDPVTSRAYYFDPNDGTRFQYTDNGGTDWTPATTGLPTITLNGNVIPDKGFYGKNAFVMDPNAPQRLFLGLHSVFETTTGGDPNSADPAYKGNGWRDIGPGMGINGPCITAIAVSASNPDTIYAGTFDGHIFVTHHAFDDTPSWIEVDGGLPLNNQTVMDLKVDPADPNRIFAVTSTWVNRDDKAPDLSENTHVWLSAIGGTQWVPIGGNLPPEVGGESLAVDWRFATPTLYLGTQRGVFRSTDLGTTWVQFGSLPTTRVTDLDFVPAYDLLAAATLGRGAYEILVNAPAPVVALVSPSTIEVGSPTITLTVNGANFVRSSSVQLNGRLVPTTFVNEGQLQATIDSSFFAETGSLSISVFTPGPGGGTSNPLPLTITDAPFVVSAGGPLDDVGNAVAADAVGDVYVAGNVQQSSPAAAPFGAFVTKYAPDGTPQWTQNIFGDVTDTASAIAVDPAGNAFVTGAFRGVAIFGPGFVITPASVASYNGFIEKLNPDGIVQWVQEIDAPIAAAGDAIALDAADNVYTTGALFGSARFFGPGGQLVTNPMNTNQGTSFLVKQDTSGSLLWVQQFGIPDPTLSGGDLSSANAIAVDSAGTAIYVAGGFRGHNVQFGTTYLSVAGPDGVPGPTNTFVERFDALGNSLWAVRAGSATAQQGEAEAAHGMALDRATGTVYITGSFDNTADFVSANGGPVLQLVGINGGNAYVAKLDPNGSFVHAVRFDDNGDEVGTAIAVDQAENVYATGWFSLTAQLGPFQLQSRGDLDVYVAKLDANLNVLAARQLGGMGRDRGLGIAVDNSGFVDCTGSFTGSGTFSFPPNLPVVLTSAGGTDLFVSHQWLVSSSTRVTILAGHILHLQGANTDNRIDLTDDGHGTLQVLLDDDSPRVYHGIDRIEVLTGDGNDTVSYQVGGPDLIGDPSDRPADLMVDLGQGNDRLSIMVNLPDFQPADPTPPWNVNVQGGDGNDLVQTNIQTSVPVHMTVDLGSGINTTRMIWGIPTHTLTGDQLTIRGGSGNDTILVEYCAETGGSVNPGDPPMVIDTPLVTTITGGAGQDDIRVLYELDTLSGVVFNAPIALSVDGGAGDDTISLAFGDPSMPSPVLNNLFQMRLDGGAGNDTVAADLYFASNSQGLVDALVRGGLGNDDLTLNIYGIGDPDLILALIDGGGGIDTFHHTDNVQVIG
jgi:hypothetical protein